jgi:hypothetical protein
MQLPAAVPDRPEYLIELAAVHNQLGNAALATDRFPEALHEYELAQRILTRDEAATSTSPIGRFQLAEAYRAMGLLTLIRRYGLADVLTQSAETALAEQAAAKSQEFWESHRPLWRARPRGRSRDPWRLIRSVRAFPARRGPEH